MSVLAIAVAVFLPACGPTSSGQQEVAYAGASRGRADRPVAQFPDEPQVDQLAESDPPDLTPLWAQNTAFVPSWTLEAMPVPDNAEIEPAGPLEAGLAQALHDAGRRARATGAMRCVAAEYARFFHATESYPSPSLSQFIGAACGSPVLEIQVQLASGPLEGPLDRRVAQPDFEERFARWAAAIPREADYGVVGHEADGQMVVLTAFGPPAVQVHRSEVLEEIQTVRLEGRFLRRSGTPLAFINHGRYGHARCVSRPVAPPMFSIRCPVPDDGLGQGSWITVATMQPGQVLMHRVANVFAGLTPESRPTYEALLNAPEGDAAPTDDLVARFVGKLNEVRTAAGMNPVSLAAEQSELNQAIAPHVLQALIAGDEAGMGVASLALLAGWRVDGGIIRDGGISFGAVATADPVAWLASSLAAPSGRAILLDPESRALAVGLVANESPPGLGAVVTTYAYFDDVDPADVARGFVRRLRDAREERGLPPPRWVRMNYVSAAAEAVTAGQATPERALQAAVNRVSQQRPGRRVHGSYIEAVRPDLIDIPEELLAQRELSVAVAAAHRRVEGGAWGQHVLLIVYRQ